MFRINRLTSTLFTSFALLTLAIPAAAEPQCRRVHSRVTIEAEAVPTCGSPIGLCANTTYRGQLKGTSSFVGTSFLPTVDTGATGTVVLTGDNLIHLGDGDLVTKDAIVLSTLATGEFAEVDTILSGTGAYAGATGNLTATGTFINGVGEGVLEGVICTP